MFADIVCQFQVTCEMEDENAEKNILCPSVVSMDVLYALFFGYPSVRAGLRGVYVLTPLVKG